MNSDIQLKQEHIYHSPFAKETLLTTYQISNKFSQEPVICTDAEARALVQVTMKKQS